MKIVSGRTGSPHVTSQQFRQMLEGILGQDSYILTSGENLKPELSSNNLLKIRSGMMCHHGCISCVEIGTYDEVTLTNGSHGMQRIDLVVNRYTRNAETEVEKCEWKVITGTAKASSPAVPTYTKSNLQEGDLVDECPVFEIHYNGINVTEVKSLLSVVGSFAELNGKSYELIKVSDNRYVKKYADGRFEAYGHIAIKDLVFANQIGSSGVYYAQYQNLNIGITAKTISSVQHTANNSGVVWTGNASVSGIAMKGTILQYGNTSRATDLNYDVKGTWK